MLVREAAPTAFAVGVPTALDAFTALDVPVLMARVRGTEDADRLAGTNSDDTIEGLGGNDFLYGAAGDDMLLGGSGNDLMAGGSGADTIDGGTGIDTVDYWNSPASITVSIAPGAQRNSGGTAEGDVLLNVERLAGSKYDDELIGNNGNNLITGRSGDDAIWGGAGADWLRGNSGSDVLHGDSGNDILWGHQGFDTLNGGVGRDILFGGAADDHLTGGQGDDILDGGAGGDTLDGGAGSDHAAYVTASAAVIVDLGAVEGSRGVSGDAVGDSFMDIEGLIGSHHDDTLTGDDEANELTGNFGSDVLHGGRGNDTLRGGNEDFPDDDRDRGDMLMGGDGDDVLHGDRGADTLNGGEGTDTVSYAESPSAVETRGLMVEGGHAEGDILTGIERIVGTEFDDEFEGLLDFDGGSGDDEFTTEFYQLSIRLGPYQVIDGGDGADTVTFDNAQMLTVDLVEAVKDPGEIDTNRHNVRAVLRNVENVTGDDGGFDFLHGNAENNVLSGLGGGDVLNGRGGDDTLIGGDGRDTLNGGIGDDSLQPGAGGEASADRDGNVTRLGATYDERLAGGGGSDTFVFDIVGTDDRSAPTNDAQSLATNESRNEVEAKTITDFGANDKIDISAYGLRGDHLDALLSGGTVQVSDDVTASLERDGTTGYFHLELKIRRDTEVDGDDVLEQDTLSVQIETAESTLDAGYFLI